MLNKFILIFILSIISSALFSQGRINRMRHKERQGKWIIYGENKKIEQTGRYRNGDPKGVWKFYDANGILAKREIYRNQKIKFTFFYSNGEIKKKGKAKMMGEGESLHFYYYGTWLSYDSTGTLTKKQVYEYGAKILETSYLTYKDKHVNDTLVIALNNINNTIYKYIDSMKIAATAFGKNSMQYQKAYSLNNMYSSKLLGELDSIIAKYGYPGKTLVDYDYAIAFSIISTANNEYREKYYDLIIDAANKGELEWKDVAFFVDKVKTAKQESQVYGTRFKLDEESKKTYYYPIEDIEHLNERRTKVGLAEIDLSKMEFINY